MSINPRTAEVPIYHGDDLAKIADLTATRNLAKKKLDEARLAEKSTARAGDAVDDTEWQEARKALEDFVPEAADRATIVVLNDIGYAHKELKWEHPPRTIKRVIDGEESQVEHPDDVFGVNSTTYPMALLMFADPEDEELRTIVEPKFSGEAGLRKFLRRLPEGEFDRLWMTAMSLNEGQAVDPKAVLSSNATSGSDELSR